eukprot:5561531-Lingulodinium_polyedra.AAC.1
MPFARGRRGTRHLLCCKNRKCSDGGHRSFHGRSFANSCRRSLATNAIIEHIRVYTGNFY